jgi:hypothetical protein
MTDQERAELARYPWMESRIPAIDAISAFVPDGAEPAPEVRDARRRAGRSRWYPVPGGHRVLIPHESEDYDSSVFSIEPLAWDHEHCDSCSEQIPAMTLCHVTEPGQSYILLCAACFGRHVAGKR